MLEKFEFVKPEEIEKQSMSIIEAELRRKKMTGRFTPEEMAVVKRCIHTSADFDYGDNLCFSGRNGTDACRTGIKALNSGAHIVTDTTMAASGINKRLLGKLGGRVHCFIGDEDVALQAGRLGTTRSAVSMAKAAAMDVPLIFAIGNAPTALISLYELMQQGKVRPELIIGVPVGFVNVVESKELIMGADVPYIIARGRKGGSNIAAAICNALMYYGQSEEKNRGKESGTDYSHGTPADIQSAGMVD